MLFVREHLTNCVMGFSFQSVIILTRLPFVSLFTEICGVIAPEYFESGLKSIEAACHEMNRWPSPIPGDTLHLGLFGNVTQVMMSQICCTFFFPLNWNGILTVLIMCRV